jgi:Protein of unknown function (DUF3568)
MNAMPITKSSRPPAWVQAALIAASALAGCGVPQTTSDAGVGVYSYFGGELKSEIADSLDRTYAAARASAEQDQVAITDTQVNAGEAHIIGAEADGRSVRIRLNSVHSGLTEVRIHLGNFGNEGDSRLMLERIRFGLAVVP